MSTTPATVRISLNIALTATQPLCILSNIVSIAELHGEEVKEPFSGFTVHTVCRNNDRFTKQFEYLSDAVVYLLNLRNGFPENLHYLTDSNDVIVSRKDIQTAIEAKIGYWETIAAVYRAGALNAFCVPTQNTDSFMSKALTTEAEPDEEEEEEESEGVTYEDRLADEQ